MLTATCESHRVVFNRLCAVPPWPVTCYHLSHVSNQTGDDLPSRASALPSVRDASSLALPRLCYDSLRRAAREVGAAEEDEARTVGASEDCESCRTCRTARSTCAPVNARQRKQGRGA